MSDPARLVSERVRQDRDARFAEAVSRVRKALQSDADTRGTLLAGGRVFDTASGEEGTVDAALLPATARPAWVRVLLDSGSVVERRVSDLIPRPTPPRVR